MKCPTCKKPLPGANRNDNKFFPFCCDRCKLIDLGAWASEKYRLAAVDEPEPGSHLNDSDKTDSSDKGQS